MESKQVGGDFSRIKKKIGKKTGNGPWRKQRGGKKKRQGWEGGTSLDTSQFAQCTYRSTGRAW